MLKNIVCPISTEKIDSTVSRLTVFINAVLMVYYVISMNPVFLIIVTVDYGIRAFGYNNFSPICILSSMTTKLLKRPVKMVDKAPKMFAARLGFICALLGLFFFTLEMSISSIIIIGLFTVLAFMDSVFNFCVGCLIYHHLVLPFYKKV